MPGFLSCMSLPFRILLRLLMNGYVIPVVRIGSIWSPGSFLGRILGEWGWGVRFRFKDRACHFDLSGSNLHYENICRVILLSVTWSTHWGGRDYCLNFPLGEGEHVKVNCLYIRSFIADAALKPRFKVPLGCVTLGKSLNFSESVSSII